MKKTLLITASLLLLIAFTPNAKAQEWSTGLDIYSSYVWRGAKFGSGPAFQPAIEFSAGGFALGAWGSYNASTDEAAEADLYASYGFDLGENGSLSFTLTDYYFPGSPWMSGDAHYIEPMVNLGLGAVSLTGAYMMNGGSGDIYLEAAVTAGPVDLTLGGGDGAYTIDGGFNICNIGVATSKEIKITDDFSLPVSGAAILNPSSEQFHIVVGISL
ncbi:MAG: hypothetical protein HN778_21595 [Prolixibacteraceae bacterium]|jgi:uncharacterized protein (TIGR02001 family)|nr:hypothetical protein [Prolixibacteraceae bacterium]MBT6006716.1 hypothetical protein [Prolixibacteraceae bacterium]MBT6764143.1 hypothetical protein [Prolixibacteraceae bacterium]MBT6998630.1 hypothetical protein [Prolixibacteraceae bacterium]MBT7397431.1 hypothetical protein [Prolixibacteraceae bacterium]